MTRRKAPHERLKPGPKPGFKRSAVIEQAAQVASDAIASASAAAAVQPRRDDPLQKHRNVDTMPESELREYALQLGLTPRDARDLSVERLRVNCKHQVYALIDDL